MRRYALERFLIGRIVQAQLVLTMQAEASNMNFSLNDKARNRFPRRL